MAYVIRKQIVAQCLSRLRKQKTHTLFSGYLYLQQRASQLGRLDDLQPDFLTFFKQFFEVEGHPLGAPYIKPFTEQKPSTRNLWLNENVAGSYAPSSLRPEQPFRKVVTIQNRRYSLPPDHAQRAFEHLLYSIPVQAADLAVVLYRDFGFSCDSLTIQDLVGVFAHEFGYSKKHGGEPNDNFRMLFSLETTDTWEEDWIETTDSQSHNGRLSPGCTKHKVRRLTADDLLSLEAALGSSARQLPFQELLIEGLLSFGERTHFEFGQINVLVGPNGSGKSNLIDCMRILRHAPFDIQETFKDSGFEDWLYRGADGRSAVAFLELTTKVPDIPRKICHRLRLGPPMHSRAVLEEVVSSAGAENGESDLYFTGSFRGGATLSVSGVGKRRRERELGEKEYNPFQSILSQIRDVGQYPEITRLAEVYANFRIYSEWTFGRNSTLREATPTGRSDTTLSESMDNFPLALNALEKTAAHKKIRELLQELKETYQDYVTRTLFGRVALQLLEAPSQDPLPANRLSDGTLRFLALAAILSQPSPPPLVCLEEPELGMHPDMIRMVAKMIVDASARTQLIVTTHSEQLLTALQDDFDVLFAFDAGLAGSVVRPFSREAFREWRAEHTLGELWTSGELGGNRW